MHPDPGPHSVRQVTGRYAMPRLLTIHAVVRALALSVVLCLVGLIGMVGYHLVWAKPLVDVGCLLVIVTALRLLVAARLFWLFSGRPVTLGDPLRWIVLGAVLAAVNFAFLVVDLAAAIELSG